MMNLAEIAPILEADLVGENVSFGAVSTDSRKIAKGDLFVALDGERFRGSDFLPEAAAAGAVAAIVGEKVDSEIPLLVVKDTLIALGRLAANWRSRFSIPVVAVTGSNGKTTVKEMIASILGTVGEVLATQGNLNNDIGLPLTLLGLGDHHRFAVVEMGMNHAGEIAYLCKIANPDVALVNNAASAHLEGLGSVYDVARAKGELFENLREGAIAVINAEDPHAPLWRELAGNRKKIEFGLEGKDVRAKFLLHRSGSDLSMFTPQGEIGVSLCVPGLHNVRNALAATAVCCALGIPCANIAKGLSQFGGVPGRMQIGKGRNGALLVNDTYNANPDSVRAAISWLASQPGKRILVLGDMGELGSESASLHAQIGLDAKRAGIDCLLTLGEASRKAAESFGEGAQSFSEAAEIAIAANSRMGPEVTALVKGSRFMRMEKVVEKMEGEGSSCC